jgi:Zn-dependent metalloprotease
VKSNSRRGLVVGGVLAAGLLVAATAAAAPLLSPAGTPSTPNSPQAVRALAAQAAASAVAARPAYLHASAADAFVAHAAISGQGAQFVPYDRTYRGLPVIGGDFVIVTDNTGHVIDHSVDQTQTINLASVAPKITAVRSLTTAEGLMDRVDSTTTPTLSVFAKSAPRLAWDDRVSGTRAGQPSSLSVYVDALTGTVLGTQEHVLFGDGDAAYNGPDPVHIDTTQVGTTFEMADPTIHNLSCQDLATHQVFTKATDTWGNGDATSEETGCVDALFAAQTENKMLHTWLGRNAQDGAGGAWPIRIGLDELNAFYDGTEVQLGHNTVGQWIGSMDVIGHEMGHGVDDHTPGSISGGGTQEFVADTFGADTEWFAAEPTPFDTPDFTVGEQINLEGTGPIRIMSDPSQVGDPNCFSNAVPRMEVHAAAGPGDHWYYLLAEGNHPTNGQPVSPTCDGGSVTGVGTMNAAKIMYNAMLMKTARSSYLTYRTWTLKAAKLVFPNDCTEFNAVQAAWNAVSVPAQAGDPTCTAPAAG